MNKSYHIVSEGIKTATAIGGAIGGSLAIPAYKTYDRRLKLLKKELKKNKESFVKDHIQSEINMMENMGKKKWAIYHGLIGASAGSLIAAHTF